MSVVPQWFQQWAPPSTLYNNPFLHSNIQQAPTVYSSNDQFSETYPPPGSYPQANPFRGYEQNGKKSRFTDYPDLTPGSFLFNGPIDQNRQSTVLPGSQSVVSGNEFEVVKKDPFSGPKVGFFDQPKKERFSAWQPPSTQSFRSNKVTNVPRNPFVHLFPLLATGFIGVDGSQSSPVRGDQSPEGPDPDRDLGGPSPLRTLYHWKTIDFNYASDRERMAAMESNEFIPNNTLPLGLEIWKERVFVTFPRWKPGVPCTLATAPRAPLPTVTEPRLDPFPDWSWHRQQDDCLGLTSVFRISADRCGRLWVLDSGQVDALSIPRQVCPPQIVAFDLNNDSLIGRWAIPAEHVRENSLFTNIITDIRDTCEDVHVYIADVWRFGLLVLRLRDEKFWKFSSHLFYPDPLASDYNLHGINFQWSDGVFGISLTPLDRFNDKTLFFHAMSSYREFRVPASILRNETAVNDTELLARSFILAGESRGYSGHSSASAIDRNGVMFYNLVTRDSLACWDTRKPYKKITQGVVARDSEKLVFPNDLKIDHEDKQSVWVLSNKLPMFLYRTLNPNEINFRIMREYVEEASFNSVCDPRTPYVGPIDLEPECF